MAKLRNCNGSYAPAKNFVNNMIFADECPRWTAMNAHEARFLVELYLDCRESKTLPFPGSIVQQTAFTVEVFEFLDGMRIDAENERIKEQNRKIESERQKAASKRKK